MSSEIYLGAEQKVSRIEYIVEQHPEVAGLQAYEYFRSNVGKQKQTFIDGEIPGLELNYSDLNKENVLRIKEPMLVALRTLMPGDRSEKSEALYRAVEYRYSELFMMDMARVMNSNASTEEDRLEAERQFKLANEGLYGKPEKHVFSALAKNVILTQLVAKEEDGEETLRVRAELNELIGTIDETEYQPFVPSQELITRIGILVRERFGGLVEHIDSEKNYDVQGMKQVIETALEKMGGKELGWEVIIIPNSTALTVSAHQKQVQIGMNKTDIKGGELAEKTLHELGIHAGRSINAEKAGWISAAYGQEGYLDFEEAIANAMQDAYKGKFSNGGEDYYVIAGLVYGLDNYASRDFNQVYEIMWRVLALRELKSGSIDDAADRAKSLAFIRCLRFFRGTSGYRKGVIYLKDLAYFKGRELAWSVLKDVETQEDFDYVLAGKLDNTRDDHQYIAEQIVSANNS